MSRPTERSGGGGGGGGGGGEQGILPRGPQTFTGSHEAFNSMIFKFLGCIFMLFPFLLHCLNSMIVNAWVE